MYTWRTCWKRENGVIWAGRGEMEQHHLHRMGGGMLVQNCRRMLETGTIWHLVGLRAV